MLIKILILLVLLAIFVSLGAGLFFLVTDHPDRASRRLVTALTVRISLSVALFVLLFVAYLTGLITPHGVIP